MGVKVNESGAIKNLALDREDVENIMVTLNIPALYLSSSSVTFKPSEFGITNSYLTTDYNSMTAGKKTPIFRYADIPDTCKSIVYSGEFNFTIPVPCRTNSSYFVSDASDIKRFPNYYSSQGVNYTNLIGYVSAALDQYNWYLGTGSSDTWNMTAYIFLGLIIEDDGRHYRVEAILIRSDQITASKALSANYGYVGSKPFTDPKTLYFDKCDNKSYLIEKVPYSFIDYTTNALISK